jgi:hypothetical protein
MLIDPRALERQASLSQEDNPKYHAEFLSFRESRWALWR